jgi:hypothetical protein
LAPFTKILELSNQVASDIVSKKLAVEKLYLSTLIKSQKVKFEELTIMPVISLGLL